MPVNAVYPRIVSIGAGAVGELGSILRQMGLSRPLIVSDAFLRRQGLVDRVADLLRAEGVEPGVFTDTVPDPTTASVDLGLAALKAADYDSLIGLGGGSPQDTAKIMAILHVHGGAVRDYKVPAIADRPGLPVIAVPTTAGTGSEVTRFSIITDSASDEKMLCAGPAFVPAAAVVDYELTLSKPLRLTADTGIDSLTHAIEAYVSRRANPLSDTFALAAMKIIFANIRRVCAEPGDRQAREQMMLGSMLAGHAFTNASVGLVHGMSRPIGALFHVSHGLSNAMLLPSVTRFSARAAPARYADCARTMGIAAPGSDDGVAVSALLIALDRLNADLEVPSPRAHGVPHNRYFDSIEIMASQALESGSPGNNPRVPTHAEICELYREVWG
jgi:alcohol dehydrogenase class IV